MRPMPAPWPMGTAAAWPGCRIAASPICHSAVDEQPSVATLPFDHDWSVIQVSAS